MLAKFKPSKKIPSGPSFVKQMPVKKGHQLNAKLQFKTMNKVPQPQQQRGIAFQKKGSPCKVQIQKMQFQKLSFLGPQKLSVMAKPTQAFQTPLFYNRQPLSIKPAVARFSSVRTAADQLESRLSKTDALFPHLHLKDGLSDVNNAIAKASQSENPNETMGQFVRHLCSSHQVPASTTVQVTQLLEIIRSANESSSRMAHLGQSEPDLDSLKKFLPDFPELHELTQKIQSQIKTPEPITTSQDQEDRVANQANTVVSEIETALDFLEKNNVELANEKAEVDHYIENIDLLTVKGELQKRPALIETIDEDIVYDRWSHDEEED